MNTYCHFKMFSKTTIYPYTWLCSFIHGFHQSGDPLLHTPCHSVERGTRSNTFSRSMKAKYCNFFLLSNTGKLKRSIDRSVIEEDLNTIHLSIIDRRGSQHQSLSGSQSLSLTWRVSNFVVTPVTPVIVVLLRKNWYRHFSSSR